MGHYEQTDYVWECDGCHTQEHSVDDEGLPAGWTAPEFPGDPNDCTPEELEETPVLCDLCTGQFLVGADGRLARDEGGELVPVADPDKYQCAGCGRWGMWHNLARAKWIVLSLCPDCARRWQAWQLVWLDDSGNLVHHLNEPGEAVVRAEEM